jgi:hypothetical protein
MTSRQEVEEIRSIARSLKLPHEDFIEAKLAGFVKSPTSAL